MNVRTVMVLVALLPAPQPHSKSAFSTWKENNRNENVETFIMFVALLPAPQPNSKSVFSNWTEQKVNYNVETWVHVGSPALQ